MAQGLLGDMRYWSMGLYIRLSITRTVGTVVYSTSETHYIGKEPIPDSIIRVVIFVWKPTIGVGIVVGIVYTR